MWGNKLLLQKTKAERLDLYSSVIFILTSNYTTTQTARVIDLKFETLNWALMNKVYTFFKSLHV